ncbi:MAG: TetR family transcriptional regulator [Acidimicrobiales bacterium]|nr:TetR family transcriptional regulator [Acidimicrobiales bacterium]MCB1014058.1 TetR family transcriptional regulator [Acidimicrobiales bacterium]MCB9371488.1 TetR family transcriptional regulator [Microthrixaceae bacterium]
MTEDRPGLRERKKALTRLLLRERARALFAAQGYDTTTVAQIAAAAEVSEPTFFRYYPSKVAVALAPVTDAIALALDAVEGRPADEAPIVACLAVVAAADEHGLAPAPGAAEELRRLRTSAPLRAGVVQVFDEAADRLTVDFARRLGVRPDAPVARQTATAVMGTVLAVFRHWVDEPDGSDLATEASAGFRRLQQGLR